MAASQTFINSIRIPDRDRKSLLSEIETRAARHAGPERRGTARVMCHDLHEVLARVSHPGGSETMCVVHPRNVGRRGAAFVLGTYLHPGTHCTLLFHATNGSQAVVRSNIVHCRHVRGRIHEAGAAFEEDFDLAVVGLTQPAPAPLEQGQGGGAGQAPSVVAAMPPGSAAVGAAVAKLRELIHADTSVADLKTPIDELVALCRQAGLLVEQPGAMSAVGRRPPTDPAAAAGEKPPSAPTDPGGGPSP